MHTPHKQHNILLLLLLGCFCFLHLFFFFLSSKIMTIHD